MKVALKLPGDKYSRDDMMSWKLDLEKAFIQLNPITIINPTSWTPGLAGTTAAGTPTYTRQYGEWSQIGQRVFFNCYVTISAIGGMTGTLKLVGLPKPMRNVANMYVEHATRWSNVTFGANGTACVAQQSPGASECNFVEMFSTGAAVLLPIATLAATADFLVTGNYPVQD